MTQKDEGEVYIFANAKLSLLFLGVKHDALQIIGKGSIFGRPTHKHTIPCHGHQLKIRTECQTTCLYIAG